MSRRLVADAIATRLVGVTHAVGYYSQIGRALPGAVDTPHDPPAKSPTDPRVAPYLIFWPGAGGDGPDPQLCGRTSGVSGDFAVTAAAGDIDDLLALIDRIDARLLGWTPTAAGVTASARITRRPGYVPPILTDPTKQPERLYARLEYLHTFDQGAPTP